jgi:hypothetical protein
MAAAVLIPPSRSVEIQGSPVSGVNLAAKSFLFLASVSRNASSAPFQSLRVHLHMRCAEGDLIETSDVRCAMLRWAGTSNCSYFNGTVRTGAVQSEYKITGCVFSK